MEYQKFIPEGWNVNLEPISKETLDKSFLEGNIIQGRVEKCDARYNLYVTLAQDTIGIIPREEVEAINVQETGLPKPNICLSKVNQYVQFKIIDKDTANNRFILSRKQVGKEALEWLKEEVIPGSIVNGIVKNIQPYGAFVEIGRWNSRVITHRRYVHC